MQNILNEIKEIIQSGIENSILNNEPKSKEIFFKLSDKIVLALNNLNSETKTINYNKTVFSQRTYEYIDDETRKKMQIVAYCFSTYEHDPIFPNCTQTKALEIAAEKLGVKKNTLKQTRDAFDGHNNNHRQGYHQKDLSEPLKQIKDLYGKKSKNEVVNEVKSILGLV